MLPGAHDYAFIGRGRKGRAWKSIERRPGAAPGLRGRSGAGSGYTRTVRALLTRLGPVLALAGLAPSPAAQLELSRTYAESVWTTEEGLPQDSVNDVCEDAAGYLWVATFGGLARFDGVEFDVFSVGNRPDLAGSRFLSVACDADGGVWTAAQRVGLLHYADDRFREVETHGINPVVEDGPAGDIWVRSSAGLERIVDGEARLEFEGTLRDVYVAPEGSVYATDVARGLIRIVDGEAEVIGIVNEFPDKPFITMVQDREGRLWGANWHGLWRATDATNRDYERLDDVGEFIRHLELDTDGAVWISSANGVFRWMEGRFERVLDRGSLEVMFADGRGNLWCARSTGGLRLLRASVLRDATAELGLNQDDVWSVSVTPDDELLAVQYRVVHRFTARGRETLGFDFNVHAALQDPLGRLWVAGAGRVALLEPGSRREFREPPSVFGDNQALHHSTSGALYIGARGLARFDGTGFVTLLAGEVEDVHCLIDDPDGGGLWIGTQRGLVRTTPELDGIEWWTVQDGLSPGAVRGLHRDERGVLWIATYGGGLSRMEDGELTRYTRATGLPDDFLSNILEDDQGRFWINSNRGPFCVPRSSLDAVARGEREAVDCFRFTPGEGAIEASGGNQPSAAVDARGRFWFPHIEGLSVANPSDLQDDEPAPNIVLESVELSESRELRVEFAVLGFTWPARVRAQYRLADIESDWRDARGRREVEFTYLPPGDYELQLRARNGFGPWHTTDAHTVTVPARFYETWTFRALSALAVGLAISGFAVVRLRRMRAHTNRLREVYRGRDAARAALSRSREELRRLSQLLLSEKDDHLRTVSAELHDDICQRLAALAIQMETLERKLDREAAPQAAGMRPLVREAQVLAGDVQKLSHRLHPLGLGIMGMTEALRQECDALQRRASLDVTLTNDVASDEVPEDVAAAAVRIAQEALHNAEKHAGASRLRVDADVENGCFVLQVRDDGAGFDLEASQRSGLGLVTMRERAASVGGELDLRSVPGSGTTVEFSVDLSRRRR